ncbi:hypothetical protein ACFX2B_023460 [Malus domestica]
MKLESLRRGSLALGGAKGGFFSATVFWAPGSRNDDAERLTRNGYKSSSLLLQSGFPFLSQLVLKLTEACLSASRATLYSRTRLEKFSEHSVSPRSEALGLI